MPPINFRILFLAVVLFFLCRGMTLQDRILIDSLHKIEKESLLKPSKKLLFEGAIGGMVDELRYTLGDHYSAYIPYSDQQGYEDELDNRFDGIGVILTSSAEEKGANVLYPIIPSPAFKAGIRAGDSIVRVDGVETETLPFHKISELIRGESGTEVKLSVRHLDKKEAREITVKRGPIHRDSVEGEHVDAEGKRIYFLETEPEIAYIRITSFSNRTAEEVADALQAIKERPSKGLILDLRGNPGGFVSVCVEIANYFIHPTEENDVIVSTRYQNGKTKENYRTRRDGQLFEKPMVVLIDGDSASASEILSAALQDYHRAAIVGQRSFGKGIVQEIFTLPLKSGKLQLTDASYWRPNGQNIHRTKDAKETDQWGVTPDPEGLVSVSQEQSFAQLQIRERRSNILAPDLDPVVSEYLTQLPKEVEAHLKYIRSMEKEEKSLKDDGEQNNGEFEGKEKGTPESPDDSLEQKEKTPFVLEGNAPYYDPQLEKGIEILLKRVS